jgi:hypothetical protein
MIWGTERTKKDRIAHKYCERCKRTDEKHYAKGMCRLCYEEYGLTGILNPRTGRRLTRGQYRAMKQKEYPRKLREKRRLKKQ